MSGVDYLIDTNILVYILQGNPLVRYFAQEEILVISCISEMETLGKFQISEVEKEIVTRLLRHCNIIDINNPIKQLAIKIRQNARLKLPDAIVAATAIHHKLTLVTADKDFKNIPDLDLLLIKMEK